MHPYTRGPHRAYNMYLSWLQSAAHPMSLAEVFTFDLQLHRLSSMQALGAVQALTPESYRPLHGNGTALYNAVGQTCTTATQARAACACGLYRWRGRRAGAGVDGWPVPRTLDDASRAHGLALCLPGSVSQSAGRRP